MTNKRQSKNPWKNGLMLFIAMAAGWAVCCWPGQISAADKTTPKWIWHDEGDPVVEAPAGTRFFRKRVRFNRTRVATVDITCDDEFALYLNGQEIGRGNDWHRVYRFDLTKHVRVGNNVLAVLAKNHRGPAALLVRGYAAWDNGTQWTYSADGSWRSSALEQPGWTAVEFDDSNWTAAKVLGEYGTVGPWRKLAWDSGRSGRFTVPPGFRIETVAAPALTGSVIAMSFDSLGRPTISREHGPVGILEDTNGDGRYDRLQDFGDSVTDSQGFYWLGRRLYVSGRGPEGDGLYRLSDENGNGKADKVELLTKYRGGIGGHGPHAIILGPDGMLYHIIGNHALIAETETPRSPIVQKQLYEGNLLPRYEDPRGHAAGIRMPAGTIWRCDREGKNWELITCGMRNPYDIAFHSNGELFTFDADMEWDVGLPWYRPTRVLHCVPGADFGWRSGSAKWPAHYPDSLPAVMDTGRGSPTGVAFYQHDRFPQKYRNTLWLGDWTNGRILVHHLKQHGATYASSQEIFATGEPMNITDLEIGPDGNVYFCTGGWGTEGGLYRISYTPKTAQPETAQPKTAQPKTAQPETAQPETAQPETAQPETAQPETAQPETAQPETAQPEPSRDPIEQAIHQPQPLAAWAVARVEQIRQQTGDAWESAIVAIASDTNRTAADRVRAVDLLEIHGPRPSQQLAIELAGDQGAAIRLRAAAVLGGHATAESRQALMSLLHDPNLMVRRRAAEALSRHGGPVDAGSVDAGPVDAGPVLELLSHEDRFVRYAARLLLQRIDPAAWTPAVMRSTNPAVVVEGFIALHVVAPGENYPQRLAKIVAMIRSLSRKEESLSDMLRIAQLLLLESDHQPAAEELKQTLIAHFPTKTPAVDREIARLLAKLDAGEAVKPIVTELLAPDASRPDQIHDALCLRFFDSGWVPRLRRQYLDWFEGKQHWEGGYSFSMYIRNILDDALAKVPVAERQDLVRDRRDTAPLVVSATLRSLSAKDLVEIVPELIEIQQSANGEDAAKLVEETVLALGRCGDERATQYLRDLIDKSAKNGDAFIRSLTQIHDEKNWPYLIKGLQSADSPTLRIVIEALERFEKKPDDAAIYRSLIEAGERLGQSDGLLAVKLLNRWTGLKLSIDRKRYPEVLKAQKSWFAQSFPGEHPPSAKKERKKDVRTFDEILEYLTGKPRGISGSVDRGRHLFEQSQCIKCHRFEGHGNGIGPDLTTLSKRFKRRDILTAIYYPSRDINDQYQSVALVTTDGLVLTGMAGPPEKDHMVLLQADTTVRKIPKSEVEEFKITKVSVMPENSLADYTLNQIADLIAYLESGTEAVATETPANK